MKNNVKKVKRILVAPLDWGLGHATRCIPIINELIAAGHEVFLAGDGKVKALLEQEFPDLPFLALKGYGVHYSKTGRSLVAVMFLQIPKILGAIRYEHRWLKQAIQEYGFDVVISDNRYGLYSADIYSIFITHQLLIKATPHFSEKLIQKINYSYINRFNECWVPDNKQQPYLAGELAHPSVFPAIPVEYIGPLSRFNKKSTDADSEYCVILLSGPEPQRSILEQKILEQLNTVDCPVLLVRGLPGAVNIPDAHSNVTIKNHLSAQQLEQALLQASMVVSRCGYSTVMDLMAMKKKSILIPTPGQTEQEYLAEYLMRNNLALCMEQKKFNLQSALSLASSFPYNTDAFDSNDLRLKEAISQLTLL